MRTLTIILDGEQPESWNGMQAGTHWARRAPLAKQCKAVVRAALDPEWPMFTRPVNITLIAYYQGDSKHKLIDSPNIYSKPYIDGLIGWLIVDDAPLYVRRTATESRIDKARPRLEIQIEEIPPDLPETGPSAHLNGCMFSCSGCGRKFKQLAQLLEHRDLGECGGGEGEV